LKIFRFSYSDYGDVQESSYIPFISTQPYSMLVRSWCWSFLLSLRMYVWSPTEHYPNFETRKHIFTEVWRRVMSLHKAYCKYQDRQCTYERDMYLRSRNHRCHEKVISIKYSECVCCLSYPGWKAHASHYTSSVACMRLPHFFTLFRKKWQDVRKTL